MVSLTDLRQRLGLGPLDRFDWIPKKSLNLTKRCWCTSSMYQYMEQQVAATSPNPWRCPSSSADHTWTADSGPGICLHCTRDCLGRKFRNRTLHGRFVIQWRSTAVVVPPFTEDCIAIPSGSIIFVRLRATMGSETIWSGCPGRSRRKTEIGWYYSNEWSRYLNMVSC